MVCSNLERASSQDNESPMENSSQVMSLKETIENDTTSVPSGNKENSSNSTFYLAITSAITGGMLTLAATHFNNKFRRYELEYNYRKKLEKNYLSNAQKHSNDVYIPLYKGLIDFQNYWMNANDSRRQDLKNRIDLLKQTKDDLETNGSTVFLIPSVESNFNRLVKFLYNSLVAKEDIYGVLFRYNVLGEERYTYTKLSKEKYHKTKASLQIIPIYLKIARSVMPFGFLPFSGLLDWKFEIVLDSAPSSTKEFEDQLFESIENLKNEIKDITLGIK